MNQLFFVSLSTYIKRKGKKNQETSQEQEHHPPVPCNSIDPSNPFDQLFSSPGRIAASHSRPLRFLRTA
jgi:hypothetical protein